MLGKWYGLVLASSALSIQAMAECPTPISASELDVFPSAKSLPENLLRFYVYFPRPMGREIAASDIRLVDSDGQEISQAFLPMRFDLWSTDRRRLTLILDPGRVKTGLASHEAFGRALNAGNRFELQISSALKDFEGCGLGADASFGFSVRSADRDPVAPDAWSIEGPIAGTRKALRVDLGHPHDHLSMAYRIRVADEGGQTVAGMINLEAYERIWTFVPRHPWTASNYKIVIDERLEDLSGNRPGVAFEREPNTPAQDWAREITFTPKP